MDTIFGYLQSGASAVIPFIILLGLLIFVHEMGHFLVAKFFGVRVEVFSLGFGKKIFSFKRGDTTYAISLIPLGGYVKMYGDEINADIPAEQKKYSFTHKPVSQRIGVVIAGPLMNFFFAIFVLFIVAMLGEDARAPKVGDVVSNSQAFSAGFRSGDQILTVDAKPVKTWDEFEKYIGEKHDQTVSIQVQRENVAQTEDFQVVPKLLPNPNVLSLQENIGAIDGVSFLSKASLVGVKYDSVAYKAGLRTGDLINAINGNPVQYFRELDNIFVSAQGQPIELDVERLEINSQKSEKLKVQIPTTVQFASMAVLGIEGPELYLADIKKDSPAMKAGLKSGDRVAKVGSTEPKIWEDVLNIVKSYKGEGQIEFKVLREGKIMDFAIAPEMTSQMTSQGGEEKRFTIGIVPWIAMANISKVVIKADGVGAALVRGFDRTVEITKMTVVSFVRLIQTKISPKNIGGVISIGQAASETYKAGITSFLQMMAVISVNLFILNLLPIPVLDGGHLLFYTIEAIKGSPLSLRKMEIAQQVGLVVLMSLMVFALFNDFTRLFGIW